MPTKVIDMDTTSLNMKAIKRIDPTVVTILSSASRAAVYDYDKNSDRYLKIGKNQGLLKEGPPQKNCQVTGSLFIYKRNVSPHYALMLMNVKNSANIVLTITKEVLVKQDANSQVILWKSGKDVKCLWFHDLGELQKIWDQVIQISENEKQIAAQSTSRAEEVQYMKTSSVRNDNKNVDIMKMLSEAKSKRAQQFPDNKLAPVMGNATLIPQPSYNNLQPRHTIHPGQNPLTGAISVVDLESPLRSSEPPKSNHSTTLQNTAFSKLLPKLKGEDSHQHQPQLQFNVPQSSSTATEPQKPLSLLTRSQQQPGTTGGLVNILQQGVLPPPSGGSRQSTSSSSPDSIQDATICGGDVTNGINLANDLKKLLIKPPTSSAFKQIIPGESRNLLTTMSSPIKPSFPVFPSAKDIRSRMSTPPTQVAGSPAKLKNQQKSADTTTKKEPSTILMSPDDFMPKLNDTNNASASAHQHMGGTHEVNGNRMEWLASYMSQAAEDPLFPVNEIKFAEVMINLLKYDPEFRSRMHESYMQQYRRQNGGGYISPSSNMQQQHNHNNSTFMQQTATRNMQYRDNF